VPRVAVRTLVLHLVVPLVALVAPVRQTRSKCLQLAPGPGLAPGPKPKLAWVPEPAAPSVVRVAVHRTSHQRDRALRFELPVEEPLVQPSPAAQAQPSPAAQAQPHSPCRRRSNVCRRKPP